MPEIFRNREDARTLDGGNYMNIVPSQKLRRKRYSGQEKAVECAWTCLSTAHGGSCPLEFQALSRSDQLTTHGGAVQTAPSAVCRKRPVYDTSGSVQLNPGGI